VTTSITYNVKSCSSLVTYKSYEDKVKRGC